MWCPSPCQPPAPHSCCSVDSLQRADPPGGAGEGRGWEWRDGAVEQGVCAWAVPEFLLPLEDKACFGAQMKMPGAAGNFAPVTHRNEGLSNLAFPCPCSLHPSKPGKWWLQPPKLLKMGIQFPPAKTHQCV